MVVKVSYPHDPEKLDKWIGKHALPHSGLVGYRLDGGGDRFHPVGDFGGAGGVVISGGAGRVCRVLRVVVVSGGRAALETEATVAVTRAKRQAVEAGVWRQWGEYWRSKSAGAEH